jgi:polyisoprenoid-binding protein YceI
LRYKGVSIFRGTLGDVAATLADGRLEGAAQVESISIRTPEQFRAHVLSAEFFDAANHPAVTFVSSDLDLDEDGSATVDGELTIKGITNPVTATGTWIAPSPDAFGNRRAHLTLSTVIDRTAFGLNWNMPLPNGGNALANDVTLTVDVALVQQA